jgi:hypothetical protein
MRLTGRLKDPLFRWDSLPETFRVAKLLVKHKDFKGNLKFEKTGIVMVNSGQLGILNKNLFQKDHFESIKLKKEEKNKEQTALYQTWIKFKK